MTGFFCKAHRPGAPLSGFKPAFKRRRPGLFRFSAFSRKHRHRGGKAEEEQRQRTREDVENLRARNNRRKDVGGGKQQDKDGPGGKKQPPPSRAEIPPVKKD